MLESMAKQTTTLSNQMERLETAVGLVVQHAQRKSGIENTEVQDVNDGDHVVSSHFL